MLELLKGSVKMLSILKSTILSVLGAHYRSKSPVLLWVYRETNPTISFKTVLNYQLITGEIKITEKSKDKKTE